LARGPIYKVAFKRRRQGKTNYGLRRKIVRSKMPRLVVRGSLSHIVTQLVEARPEGDKTLLVAHSKELTKNFNWNAPCGYIPAAYLTGLILGNKALSFGIDHTILDIGLQKPSIGARVFAVLKGALDAGLDIPCDKAVLPDESRVRGEHIASYAKNLVETDQRIYEKMFSKYLKKDLKPEKISEHFDQINKNILEFFKKGETND